MNKQPMQAVILAGGKGSRLKPYTAILPKPLMPIGDVPILEVVVRQLHRAGVTEIIMAVGHLAALIETYFGDGSRWGVDIRYSREPGPLGTIGPLTLIKDLRPPFIMMNGDVLTNMDYCAFMEDHRSGGAAVTIAVHKRTVDVTLGVIDTDAANRVLEYTEKPKLEYLASMGIYAIGAEALEKIEPGKYLDFPDFIKRLLASGIKVNSHPFEGIWLDIGRMEDYEQALEIFEGSKHEFLPPTE